MVSNDAKIHLLQKTIIDRILGSRPNGGEFSQVFKNYSDSKVRFSKNYSIIDIFEKIEL